MIQKVVATGNWWVAASSQQWIFSCITSHAECFGKTSNHPGDSAPLQPRFGALQLLAFPKTKITFEREEISERQWDLGKYNKAADGDWENCVGSPGAYFEGNWGITVLCTMFLVSCIFFSKCLFLYHMAGYLHAWSMDSEYPSNFVLSLNVPLRKPFGWFRRPQPRATGDWQLHHNNMPAYASCLV